MKKKQLNKNAIIKICSKEKLLLFALALLFSAASAQHAIPVSGGNASGEAGFLSYSVGQVFYTTLSGAGGFIAEGIQQPYEITAVTGNHTLANLELSAYPNPAADHLILATGTAALNGFQNLEYRLYDMNSRLLKSSEIVGDRTTVTMRHLKPSMYFIRIIADNMEIKTFKVVKN